MPKLKPHRGTKKRLTVSKNGKVLRRRATGNHFLQKKSAARKRNFAGLQTMNGQQAKNIRKKLGL